MIKPGPRNSITDVPGILVGSAIDATARTGVTAIVPVDRAVAAVDVRGGGPGTRETDLLAPDTLVEAVDAIVLSGGSVYGLAAADGVVAALAAEGRGFRISPDPAVPPSPIVPGAILYDLANEGDKAWDLEPPYRKLGIEAFRSAAPDVSLGNAGAGYGARAGAFKGGQGSASIVSAGGFHVGALACVNAFGSPVMPGSAAFWAWPFEIDGEFGGARPWDAGYAGFAPDDWGPAKTNPAALQNTTIAVVATDAALTPAEAKRVAVMAQDGMARAIRPIHAPFDGDVVFAISTGARPLTEPRALCLAELGALAADCLSRAIARGVYHAESLGAAAAYADKFGR